VLDDTSRKVFTVLWNTYRNDPFIIDVELISQRSQRTEDQVKDAVNELVKERYLYWNKEAGTFQIPRR